MEEKIIFENVRTKTKKIFIAIIILFILAYSCFISFFVFTSDYYEHIVQNNHYFDCYNEKGQSIIAEEIEDHFWEHETLIKFEGVDIRNCEYNKYTNVFDYYLHEFEDDTVLFVFITVISSIFLLGVSVFIYCIYLTKCKFSITENSIYGKKGFKKFDIAFSNIIEITKKGKGIIIKTENKQLTISTLKKCTEIYNYIKPFTPENKIEQQSTSSVDDIKLF